jgi:hypothetical protein
MLVALTNVTICLVLYIYLQDISLRGDSMHAKVGKFILQTNILRIKPAGDTVQVNNPFLYRYFTVS